MIVWKWFEWSGCCQDCKKKSCWWQLCFLRRCWSSQRGYGYFTAMVMWCHLKHHWEGCSIFVGWWTLLLCCVSVCVLSFSRTSDWIDLKDGGCQRVNGFCMSLFPCCKALWGNVSNYVVNLTAFVVSNQIYLNFHNCEVFPALWPRVSLEGSFHRSLGLFLDDLCDLQTFLHFSYCQTLSIAIIRHVIRVFFVRKKLRFRDVQWEA